MSYRWIEMTGFLGYSCKFSTYKLNYGSSYSRNTENILDIEGMLFSSLPISQTFFRKRFIRKFESKWGTKVEEKRPRRNRPRYQFDNSIVHSWIPILSVDEVEVRCKNPAMSLYCFHWAIDQSLILWTGVPTDHFNAIDIFFVRNCDAFRIVKTFSIFYRIS